MPVAIVAAIVFMTPAPEKAATMPTPTVLVIAAIKGI